MSALKRTKESVVHFLDKGVQYESLLGLNEISWGHHEGAVFTPEIKKNHFDILDSWQKGDYERMAPGGESPNQVMARQREAITYIMQHENESEILICMHGRAMRILLSWLLFDSLSKMESFKHSNMCRYQINYDGNNFSLNDDEFLGIKEIAQNLNSETLILFWQFTIKALDELDIVFNQNLSIEMFLIRLIHLKKITNIKKLIEQNNDVNEIKSKEETDSVIQNLKTNNDEQLDLQNKTVDQIKNFTQEKLSEQTNKKKTLTIRSFDDLLDTCSLKKEAKLKYELEKNINLVSFENHRIEISFNENLDKEFVKILSLKLYEWTGDRWIITLSKKKGEPSKKEKDKEIKKTNIENAKNNSFYQKVLETFSDAELIDVKSDKEND